MNLLTRIPLDGTVAESNLPPSLPTGMGIGTVGGECNGARYKLSIDDCTRKNMFLEGSPRSGKTNCVNLMLKQIIPNLRHNDRCVIFDARGSFYSDFFNAERGDIVISTLTQHEGETAKWNIFSEVQSLNTSNLEQRDLLIREMSEYIVKDEDASDYEFFIQGARNLLCGVIDHAILSFNDPKSRKKFTLDNALLRQVLCCPSIFDPTKAEERHPLLCFPKDYRYEFLNDYFAPNSTWRAPMDFKAFANHAVNNIFFGEAFGAKNGDFSIKKFANEGGGRCLFIEYDVNHGEILDRIYSLLLDLFMKELMSNDDHPGTTYIILDELNLVASRMIETVCNFGGGQNIRVIATCQSHSSLYEKYGANRANGILSSFSSFAFFSCGDPVAREWIKSQFGEAVIEQIKSSGYTITTTTMNDYVVSDSILSSLRVGEAVVTIPGDISGESNCPPFIFRFDKYTKL